jgi:hypothetical protein
LGEDPELNQKQQILQEIKWMALRELSERDRVYLWSAGLLGVSDFLEEIENWGDDISYPLRPESKPDYNESINSLKKLMAEIHSQTKDIPSEVIEQEIEEAIKEVRKSKHHVKSSF